ncbi:MAG TPA: ABC transporter substrate-binding protein [Terriglobales bacterium]|jgi:NitT/TauT family transport system substrate-binding protein|nr:ABC transporter substrate-binding protein [Terriglobales bacterium]
MRLVNFLKTFVFIAAFVMFGIAGEAAQSLQKIRIGYPSISSRQAQLWLANDEGLFRKYRVDVELIFLRGGQVAIQALTGGDPPIVTIGNVIIENLQGHDIVLVGSVENSYDQSVFARPGTFTRVEELKGKRFGISGFGSATHNAALILFKKYNLEPGKDVAFVPTGTGPERLAAMGAGRIDATFFNPSEGPQALKAGFFEIIQMADIGYEVQGSGLATSRSYIKARRDIVKSVLKAYIEGIYFAFANRSATLKSLARYMRTNDPEVLDYSYQHYLKRTPKKPYPTMKGIQNLIDMSAPQVPQAKSAKPEQFVDLSFLQELERAGFFADMERRYK